MLDPVVGASFDIRNGSRCELRSRVPRSEHAVGILRLSCGWSDVIVLIQTRPNLDCSETVHEPGMGHRAKSSKIRPNFRRAEVAEVVRPLPLMRARRKRT